jgi:hypothetical protein
MYIRGYYLAGQGYIIISNYLSGGLPLATCSTHLNTYVIKGRSEEKKVDLRMKG